MHIKFLSESVINRIAAGEVIERPASVIKELVENSIDAGAQNITITLEQAGKNLIVITDDGVGIIREDLEIAAEKNTTSKLFDENDLLNINSFGFRGEALASIGAISKMFITSKFRDAEEAYMLQVIGGKEKSVNRATHHIGTKVEIRDLFFATPARLKFMRSDKTEYLACVNMVKKIALAHPHVSFTLIHDDRKILMLQATADHENIYQKRTGELLGKEFEQNSFIINYQTDRINIVGATSLPTYTRANAEDQFLFVNNRPVKDKILAQALRIAYMDFIAKDRYPQAVIFINLKAEDVDVNVHPAKTEVRFHDPNFVRAALIQALKNGLEQFGSRVSNNSVTNFIENFQSTKPFFKHDQSEAPPLQEPSKSLNTMPGVIKNAAFTNTQGYNQSKVQSPYSKPSNSNYLFSKPLIHTPPEANKEDQSNLEQHLQFEEYPMGAAKAQLHKTYIISQTKDSIIITDQHAADERLGYERIKEQFANNSPLTQRLLFPEIIELQADKAHNLISKQEYFKSLGLTFEILGKNAIAVTEIPAVLGEINVGQLVQDITDNLTDIGQDIALDKLLESVLETYACHYSVRAGKTLNIQEMNELLRQMEQVRFSGQCNHGRPTYVELTLKDIEKLFGRR